MPRKHGGWRKKPSAGSDLEIPVSHRPPRGSRADAPFFVRIQTSRRASRRGRRLVPSRLVEHERDLRQPKACQRSPSGGRRYSALCRGRVSHRTPRARCHAEKFRRRDPDSTTPRSSPSVHLWDARAQPTARRGDGDRRVSTHRVPSGRRDPRLRSAGTRDPRKAPLESQKIVSRGRGHGSARAS